MTILLIDKNINEFAHIAESLSGLACSPDLVEIHATGHVCQVDLTRIAACRQLRAWEREIPQVAKLTMSVNLSPKQLLKREMVEHVAEILRRRRITRLSAWDGI